jgi:ABC-type sulfate transport system permease component
VTNIRRQGERIVFDEFERLIFQTPAAFLRLCDSSATGSASKTSYLHAIIAAAISLLLSLLRPGAIRDPL